MMTMKSCLSGPFLLLLLSSTVSGSVLLKYYLKIQSPATWHDAQHFCRSSSPSTDLAIIYTQSDTEDLYLDGYLAWIGLYKKDSFLIDSWIWSDGQRYNYKVWAENEPHNSESCAAASYSHKRFRGSICEESWFFICYELQDDGKYEYIFIPQSKTWSEAQRYCKEKYYDLATIKDNSDMQAAVGPQDFPVWIGLHRDGETWKWGTGLSEYRNWASSEPGNNGDCVSISSLNKEMATQNCSGQFPFICFRDNLVLVKENKTWEEALEHCRALKSPYYASTLYDLISVQPGEDHNYMINKIKEANTEMVWTGLHFLAGHWLWVNGADTLYSDLPLCPLNEQRCGALSQNDTGSVETTHCLEKRNFLCYSTS